MGRRPFLFAISREEVFQELRGFEFGDLHAGNRALHGFKAIGSTVEDVRRGIFDAVDPSFRLFSEL